MDGSKASEAPVAPSIVRAFLREIVVMGTPVCGLQFLDCLHDTECRQLLQHGHGSSVGPEPFLSKDVSDFSVGNFGIRFQQGPSGGS